MLTWQPITLANTITAALEVKVIEKEQEKMRKQMEEPIYLFVPITNQPSRAARPPEVKEKYLTNTNIVSII